MLAARFRRLLPLLILAGCGPAIDKAVPKVAAPVDKREPRPPVPTRAERELGAYYKEVQAAFAAGDAMRLAATFDPKIEKPMTYEQIIDWGKKFFAKHKSADFIIVRVAFELAGEDNAIVLLTYKVETPTGEGSFGGTERDYLTRGADGWKVTRWEKL